MLRLEWARLLSDGETCPRCSSTEQELDKAVSKLTEILAPLKIEVVLNKGELSFAEFEKDPLRSNQIWINDKPLEDWIGAQVGQSCCSGVCGTSDCRTVEVEGESYESIPADLIIKSALLAVSQVMGAERNLSCSGSDAPGDSSSNCCSR